MRCMIKPQWLDAQHREKDIAQRALRLLAPHVVTDTAAAAAMDITRPPLTPHQ